LISHLPPFANTPPLLFVAGSFFLPRASIECAVSLVEDSPNMSEGIGAVRTLKRKNVKGLALAAPTPRSVAPSESDLQIPGGNNNDNARQTAQLEIGIEYKLDLKREDLEVLKDLGHGNGGTVSKVRHMATGTIMARKARHQAV
jgi:hypothetical protein